MIKFFENSKGIIDNWHMGDGYKMVNESENVRTINNKIPIKPLYFTCQTLALKIDQFFLIK